MECARDVCITSDNGDSAFPGDVKLIPHKTSFGRIVIPGEQT